MPMTNKDIDSQCKQGYRLDLSMYLKAKISYEHDKRVEDYSFAREAIREAVYNAIAHNCYMYGVPIQIRVKEGLYL